MYQAWQSGGNGGKRNQSNYHGEMANAQRNITRAGVTRITRHGAASGSISSRSQRANKRARRHRRKHMATISSNNATMAYRRQQFVVTAGRSCRSNVAYQRRALLTLRRRYRVAWRCCCLAYELAVSFWCVMCLILSW